MNLINNNSKEHWIVYIEVKYVSIKKGIVLIANSLKLNICDEYRCLAAGGASQMNATSFLSRKGVGFSELLLPAPGGQPLLVAMLSLVQFIISDAEIGSISCCAYAKV